MTDDLKNLRREYLRGGLQAVDLQADPIDQFKLWLKQALEAQVPDPTAMVLATVAQDGQPSQRIVLLKSVDQRGFVFYTNLRSHKAQEMLTNPKVSLHFPWNVLERQVRVTGVAQLLERNEVDDYFHRRPRESQLAAWASRQSQPIASRAELLARYQSTEERFAGGEVPTPEFWGGFRVRPHQVEFWQGGAHRLHDRYRYSLQAEGNWAIERLEP